MEQEGPIPRKTPKEHRDTAGPFRGMNPWGQGAVKKSSARQGTMRAAESPLGFRHAPILSLDGDPGAGRKGSIPLVLLLWNVSCK